MKKIIALSTVLSFSVLAGMAGGHGHAQGQGLGQGMGSSARIGMQSSGTVHSNAPSGNPAASADRDQGRDRAADVGRGKKKGISKTHSKAAEAHSKTKASAGTKSPEDVKESAIAQSKEKSK